MTNREKRQIERVTVRIVNQNPNGIDTRILISQVLSFVSNSIPNANRHHIAGMLAWVLASYNFNLIVRTPGYSVIA